ncbi:hypothetical protein HYV64_03270 [Candidatus Shapirobacteria bacterium]|nr:hypothetical protein [Candidatus Shapirobacteria bacterium]
MSETKKNPTDIEKKIEETLEDINEEKVLYEWIAPERAFQRREKDFWITAVAILVLVAVIFIFIKEFFLIIALGSLMFMFYVLSTVPPADVRYRITNRGIYFGETHYYWEILEKFWFKKSLSTEMVHFGTVLKFPNLVSLVILHKDEEKLKDILIKKIPLVENPPSVIDKLTAWFAKRLPLEDRAVKTKTQEKKA